MWYLWSLFLYSVITPFLIHKMSVERLMGLTLALVFVLGFKFICNNFLDAQRVVNFYPFYVFGIMLRKKESKIYDKDNRKIIIWPVIFVFSSAAYIVLCYVKTGFCYGTGFMSSYGLSLVGFISRWLNYGLTLIMSISVIMIVPDKETLITKYGARTMNVYLLHMSIIFPMCWWLMRPIMHEWYGYCLYIVVVPAICSILFSKCIDKVMKPILLLPDKIL